MGFPSMSELEPPGSPENRREASQWLAIVADDLAAAEAVARLSSPLLGVAAYHLQQAAEKLMKALLVLNSEPFRHTHDLNDLVTRLLPLYPRLAPTLNALRGLTAWSVAFRYPGLEETYGAPPSISEIERIGALLAAFAADAGRLVGDA